MSGCKVAFKGTLYENITSNFGTVVASVGIVKKIDGSMKELIYCEPRRCEYRKFVIDKDKKIIGAILVNAIEDIGIIKNLIINIFGQFIIIVKSI